MLLLRLSGVGPPPGMRCLLALQPLSQIPPCQLPRFEQRGCRRSGEVPTRLGRVNRLMLEGGKRGCWAGSTGCSRGSSGGLAGVVLNYGVSHILIGLPSRSVGLLLFGRASPEGLLRGLSRGGGVTPPTSSIAVGGPRVSPPCPAAAAASGACLLRLLAGPGRVILLDKPVVVIGIILMVIIITPGC